MDLENVSLVPRQFTLDEWNEREYELAEKTEELESQKEELTAAIEELISKNEYLSRTLDELSQRKNELDQLIYRMSHDLRTPVTSVLGVLQVMKLEGIPSAFLFHLDHIQKKGLEMDCLLKSLSSFSQAVLQPIESEKINLSVLLSEVLDSLKSEPGFNEIQFSFQHTGNDYFCSDKSKLYLIVRNIVKNAIDFRTTHRTPLIKLKTISEEDHFQFECTDNGEGIPQEVMPKIFTMFYRGSDNSKGSGLGLYVAKQIAERLKGSITAAAMPGETSFKVTIASCRHANSALTH